MGRDARAHGRRMQSGGLTPFMIIMLHTQRTMIGLVVMINYLITHRVGVAIAHASCADIDVSICMRGAWATRMTCFFFNYGRARLV